jgi:hypothetical protein
MVSNIVKYRNYAIDFTLKIECMLILEYVITAIDSDELSNTPVDPFELK